MRNASQALDPVALHSRKCLLESTLDGEQIDIFHGYCEAQEQRWRCARRVTGHDWFNSRVVLNGHDLGYGEDPRLFVHGGQPAIVATAYNHKFGWRNHLYEREGTAFRRRLMLIPQHIPVGKNWSPFTHPDGHLGFIHSFDPPIMLQEWRRETDVILLDAVTGTNPIREAGPGNFPSYRGGSNGILLDQIVIGIGHTTRFRPDMSDTGAAELGFDYLLHRPFGWVLAPHSGNIRIFDITGPFPDEFSVIDPTSLVQISDDEFEVYTTEVSRNFHDRAGKRQVASYRFNIYSGFLNDAKRALASDWFGAERFSSRHPFTISEDCLEAELADPEHHIIYGPYVRLAEGTFEVTFQFECVEASGPEAEMELEIISNATGFLATQAIQDVTQASEQERTLRFKHWGGEATVEMRIAVRGFEAGVLRFYGASCRHVDRL